MSEPVKLQANATRLFRLLESLQPKRHNVPGYAMQERRPRPVTRLDLKRLELWLGWLEFAAERPRR